ncbi:luciferase domain-containing protein [Antarctobacter jejuensis]|uniref:luciferase domain-containing protein n=1 Tax=Antarctobacter jejuensis TaxID=1439938 RepID=UPI003FD5671D
MNIPGQIWPVLAAVLLSTGVAAADSLPRRETPAPRTTNSVPHVQIGVTPVPELSAELLNRVAAIPGVEIRNTVVSLPGAKGFWVRDNVPLARPEVIVGGREFAHLHPDGSLHASLPPALAEEAIKAGWAVSHPWADQRQGWQGFVMIYTPANRDELTVVLDLVAASYAFVTGTGG